MNQRIALILASTVWLFGAMAPGTYAAPSSHSHKSQATAQASVKAHFNRVDQSVSTPAVAPTKSNIKQYRYTALETAVASDPAGNNGTIKVDGQPFDTQPNNEPHVGCNFQIDFYNYDKGDYYANVTLETQAPTGSRQLLIDRVFIGQDAAGGGMDVDAQPTYNLSEVLSGLSPHPNQGYHVKATIQADGSHGADVKHKVFWVKCDQQVFGRGGGVTSAALPAIQATKPILPGSLPRTGNLLELLIPLAAGLLGAVYAFHRRKRLSQSK